MGNPYELCDEECRDIAIASEIIRFSETTDEVAAMNEYKNSIDWQDEVALAKAKEAKKEEAKELAKLFSRPGGYRERLKKSLNLDLDLFDKNSLKNKYETAKILFFFYMLEKRHFPRTNVLMLFEKPSMENIDNYCLGMETCNRKIISFIKNSLEKEIFPSPMRKKIKNITQSIVSEWDGFLENALLTADYIAELGHEYNFDEKYALFFLQSMTENKSINYHHSPIETLYLKVLQHEYLGQIRDILKINCNIIDIDCDKRLEFVEEMKRLHNSLVDIKYLDKYIDDNVSEIAKYVYLQEKTNRDERNRILKSKAKVRRFLYYCNRAKPLINIKDNLTELWIISCLQAILDDKEDNFDYTFPLYEDYRKHIPTPSSVLKKDERALDALQIYWVRKVVDFWYANIGRYNIRIKLRDLENLCDTILIEILSIPNCDEMLEAHQFYFRKVNQACIMKYDFLVSLIDNTLNENEVDLEIILETYKESTKMKFKLLFDYQNKVCMMSEFKIITL